MQEFNAANCSSRDGQEVDPKVLLIKNEALERELADTRQRVANLVAQLTTVVSDRDESRQMRRAALNLMEDAIAARTAEQQEYAERRRVEIAFRETEARYHTLFESMNEGFCIVERSESPGKSDVDFVILEANSAFQARSPGKDLSGLPVRELYLFEPFRWQQICEAALTADDAVKHEFVSSNQHAVYELKAFKVTGQDRQRVAILLSDVTERKVAEAARSEAARAHEQLGRMQAELALAKAKREADEAIQQSEQRFRSFMDHSPAAAYIKDDQGRYVFVNQVLERRSGRTLADWIGKTDFDLFPSQAAAQYRQRDLNVLDRNEATQFHESTVEPDGRHEYLSFKFPMRDAAGQRMVGGTAFDFTRQKRAEEKLAANEQRLRALASQISRIEHQERQHLASILHEDVQQLLIAMQMRVAMIDSRSNDQSIKDQTQILADLVSTATHAVRTLSRDLVPPALYQLGLSAGLEWLGERFQERHGLIVTVTAENDADPESDALRDVLFQCARELLLNVVKHARTGRADLTLTRRDGQHVLTVEDQGIGLTADFINRPDDTFGLFQIRERLSPLGGTLDVFCKPGSGATARVSLPGDECAASDRLE